ncbi:MAG: hypothetical protein KatS3mg031_2940 [Chitinophagales bacterium]|nr:MAG: hypothetical protein KatS3mg031_2940 [Chitinophagales bacterium]
MAKRKNTTLRNEQANHLGSQFNGGKLRIYTGAQPASPNDAASGTMLVEISIPSPAFGTASNGSVSKIGTWSGTAVATGVAGWARMLSSDLTKNYDFTVATSGGDLTIDDANITTGGIVNVTSLTLTIGGT